MMRIGRFDEGNKSVKRIRTIESHRRRGISRVDVVVSLCITVLVLTVFGTSIQSARSLSRRIACLGQLQNVGLSIQNFASGSGGRLPLLTEEIKLKLESGDGTLAMPWTMQLLPALDFAPVLNNIKRNAIDQIDSRTGATLSMADIDKIWLPVFTCPEDSNAFKKPGKLSYVINAGFMPRTLFHGDPTGLHRLGSLSWDGNQTLDEPQDIQVSASTGVTWRPNQVIQPSLDFISTSDGTSTTILLTENLQAGHWYDIDTARIAFGLPIDAKGGQVPFGSGAFFESAKRPLNTEFAGGTLTTATPQDWQINKDPKAAEGTRPRPSSVHGGGVNVIYCSGSGGFLSDRIDPHVYVKLLTSNGVTFGEGHLKPNSY